VPKALMDKVILFLSFMMPKYQTLEFLIVLTFIEFHAKSNISKGCALFMTGIIKVKIIVNPINVPNS